MGVDADRKYGHPMTKQELVDEIGRIAQLGKRYRLARGSSVPSALFIDLEEKFGIPHAKGMENRAATFCDFYNIEWDQDCDSSWAPSGGGGTVTRHGLEQLLRAVNVAVTGADELSS